VTFAQTLAAEQKRLGLTHPQLAQLLEVSERTVRYWLAGKSVPMAVTQEGCFRRLTEAFRDAVVEPKSP
jgi:transcriptional regulator with XRE-family HTH domain